jgi:hypothetical protein
MPEFAPERSIKPDKSHLLPGRASVPDTDCKIHGSGKKDWQAANLRHYFCPTDWKMSYE